ncbi:MAG: iron ABC transporter permease [Clostridia bacterium]|nr:iron ABC transporter permease [Clostridia bacterium]
MVYEGKKNFFIKYMILIVILGVVVIISACLGAVKISLHDTILIFASKIPVIKNSVDLSTINSNNESILLTLRLPRILMALLVGSGLSMCGAVFQGIFKNPLADPYILGISSGASLGAAIAIAAGTQALFLGFGLISISAFIGAFIVMFLVYFIAKAGGKLITNTLILSGVAVSFMCQSFISLLIIASKENTTRIVFWTMGSMTSANYTKLLVMLPIIFLGFLLLMSFSKDINILSSGDETAVSIGINVNKVKLLLLSLCSLITALSVAFCGVIGFVGLIIPHAVRLISGPDHKNLIPLSALAGAIFLISCDTLARLLLAPTEIPIGAITAVFGAPFFIYLLVKSKRKVFL